MESDVEKLPGVASLTEVFVPIAAAVRATQYLTQLRMAEIETQISHAESTGDQDRLDRLRAELKMVDAWIRDMTSYGRQGHQQ